MKPKLVWRPIRSDFWDRVCTNSPSGNCRDGVLWNWLIQKPDGSYVRDHYGSLPDAMHVAVNMVRNKNGLRGIKKHDRLRYVQGHYLSDQSVDCLHTESFHEGRACTDCGALSPDFQGSGPIGEHGVKL